jgi:hypothetical protein
MAPRRAIQVNKISHLLQHQKHHCTSAGDPSLPHFLDFSSPSSLNVPQHDGSFAAPKFISKHASIVKLHQRTFSNNFVRTLHRHIICCRI